jgi:hypothetical protein
MIISGQPTHYTAGKGVLKSTSRIEEIYFFKVNELIISKFNINSNPEISLMTHFNYYCE